VVISATATGHQGQKVEMPSMLISVVPERPPFARIVSPAQGDQATAAARCPLWPRFPTTRRAMA
jgi:hypothetical protein